MMTNADQLYYQAKITELKSILKEINERYNASFLVAIRTSYNEEQDICDTFIEGSGGKVIEMFCDFAEDAPQIIPFLIIAAKAAEKTLKQ